VTPGARVAAAIEILDDILAGAVPEKALTGWGRTHRFAGAKDRAAIRDHLFDALRCQASYAWIGGAKTGRGIMLGSMREASLMADMFNSVGHAPKHPTDGEAGGDLNKAPRHVRKDVPEWLLPHFDAGLGDAADDILGLMRHRAGVFLRVNLARTSVENARTMLRADDIETQSVADIRSALQVVINERRISNSAAYKEGLIELQDTSSQIAVDALGLERGTRVLDFCAGGGGKSLAMAAQGADVVAHDIDPRRMIDIAPRAERAQTAIRTATLDDLQKEKAFDLVLCDAPCSGSGTWRRTPAAKWALTQDRLAELGQMQASVLDSAAPFVRAGGTLVYATCSVFGCENSDVVQAFTTRNSDFLQVRETTIQPHKFGDGFFFAMMCRTA
jgi:16S rRNA (cytosine967-C5)-methyltransferase